MGGYARGRDLPKVTLPLSKLNDHGIGGCKEGRIRTWLLTLPHTAKSNHLRRHVRPQKTWPCWPTYLALNCCGSHVPTSLLCAFAHAVPSAGDAFPCCPRLLWCNFYSLFENQPPASFLPGGLPHHLAGLVVHFLRPEGVCCVYHTYTSLFPSWLLSSQPLSPLRADCVWFISASAWPQSRDIWAESPRTGYPPAPVRALTSHSPISLSQMSGSWTSPDPFWNPFIHKTGRVGTGWPVLGARDPAGQGALGQDAHSCHLQRLMVGPEWRVRSGPPQTRPHQREWPGDPTAGRAAPSHYQRPAGPPPSEDDWEGEGISLGLLRLDHCHWQASHPSALSTMLPLTPAPCPLPATSSGGLSPSQWRKAWKISLKPFSSVGGPGTQTPQLV